MPAYIIADIRVTDAAAYEPYRPLAAASIASFGSSASQPPGAIFLGALAMTSLISSIHPLVIGACPVSPAGPLKLK